MVSLTTSDSTPEPVRDAMGEDPADLPPPWDGEIVADDRFLEVSRPLLLSDPSLALAVGRKALRQSELRGDADGAVRGLLRMASAQTVLGDPGAPEIWGEVFRRSERIHDSVLRCLVLGTRIEWLTREGRCTQALTVGREALALAQASGREDLARTALHNLAITLSLLDELDLSLEVLEELEEPDATSSRNDAVAEDVRRSRSAVAGHVYLQRAQDLRLQGEHEAAAQAYARARTLVESSLGDRGRGLPLLRLLPRLDTLVQILLDLGLVDEARARVREATEGLGDEPRRGTYYWGHLQLVHASIELAGGASGAEARALADRLHEVERIDHASLRDAFIRPVLLRLLATAHEQAGDFAEALRYHKLWAEARLRQASDTTRERVLLLRHDLTALRGEAIEFITHDLRNPLVSAQRHLGALEADPAAEPVRDALRVVARCTDRAFSIADQALSIMRAELVQRSELRRVDLSALVDDLCEQMAPPPGNGVQLHRHIEQGVQVLGDHHLLMRALDNMVSNALRHAPNGTAVSVALTRHGDKARLSVTDLGPGMAPSMRLRLYQRYATTRVGQGNGLGLALIARVARLHRARIGVESASGAGTTIAMTLATC